MNIMVSASCLVCRLSAASHGRRQVDALDCLLLQHVVWRQPEERSAVRTWLWEVRVWEGAIFTNMPLARGSNCARELSDCGHCGPFLSSQCDTQ